MAGSRETGQEAAAERLILALDVPDLAQARALVRELAGVVSFYKIGMELIYAGGLALASELVAAGHRVFLDAKLLDIGHTVERATASIARLGVHMLTVHGCDRKTLHAAIAGRGTSQLKLLAVTVMTNLDGDDLAEQGMAPGITPQALVLRRARLACTAGFDGVIASAHEAADLRAAIGLKPLIITPGIRMSGDDHGDQTRIMSPAQAIAAGASHLVVGRPILRAPDPRQAAQAIIADIAAAPPTKV